VDSFPNLHRASPLLHFRDFSFNLLLLIGDKVSPMYLATAQYEEIVAILEDVIDDEWGERSAYLLAKDIMKIFKRTRPEGKEPTLKVTGEG